MAAPPQPDQSPILDLRGNSYTREIIMQHNLLMEKREQFYRHHHLFWEGFLSPHQILDTLLLGVRWLQSSGQKENILVLKENDQDAFTHPTTENL